MTKKPTNIALLLTGRFAAPVARQSPCLLTVPAVERSVGWTPARRPGSP